MTIKSNVQNVVLMLTFMVIVETMEIHSASTVGTLMLRNATDAWLNVRNSDPIQLSTAWGSAAI